MSSEKDTGMNGRWVEIFRAGRQTASNGITIDWTEAQLDHAVASYDPATHEAPVVIGHPKDNAPAYGWIEGLRREGPVLQAKLRQVSPEFAQMVNDGRFKKRSVSFYPDGTLRHVGFLGAMPPAVKGLADIKFGEEDCAEYEFATSYTTPHQEETMTPEEAREHERLKLQVEALEKDNKTLKSQNTEFAEQVKTANDKAAKAEKDLADQKAAEAKNRETRSTKEITEFVEKLVADGRIKPADKDTKIAQLTAAAKVQQYEFAEDGNDTFGALKAAFKALPVQDELRDYSDSYPKADNPDTGLDADAIMKKM